MTIDIDVITEDSTAEATIVRSVCCGSTDGGAASASELNAGDVKRVVRDHYAAIVRADDQGCGCGCTEQDALADDGYEGVAGYFAGADLGLGCGIPTESAGIEVGHDVLDLGSGAGIDAFVARQIVGEAGTVIGVDMTPEMVERATANADALGFENVRFLHGDIENLPIADASVDVVVSNCVLNLVPDKQAAFSEMYRVLRPGGHFAVSDIVTEGDLPPEVRASAEMYAGCVAGAIDRSDYLEALHARGFVDLSVVKERDAPLPDELLADVLGDPQTIQAYRDSGAGVQSITVVGYRPETNPRTSG